MTIYPAYGRDYKSKKEAIEAWKSGVDFGSLHGYVSLRDVETLKANGVKSLSIRYKKLTQQVIYDL